MDATSTLHVYRSCQTCVQLMSDRHAAHVRQAYKLCQTGIQLWHVDSTVSLQAYNCFRLCHACTASIEELLYLEAVDP